MFHFVLLKDTVYLGHSWRVYPPSNNLSLNGLKICTIHFFLLLGVLVLFANKKLPMAWLLLRETMHLRRCGYMF